MKKRIELIVGLVTIILCLPACSNQNEGVVSESDYQTVSFISAIEKDDCLLCGNGENTELALYFGQDNVGLLDINTCEVELVEINRYDDSGQQIEKATGCMQLGSREIGNAKATMIIDVDRGWSHVNISGADEEIDGEALGAYLCQDCLDDFTSQYLNKDSVSAIAMISFSTKEIRPLADCYTWFALDNYLVDCSFKDDGDIGLRITYRPVRYQEE